MVPPCCFFSSGWVKKMIPGTFYHVSLWSFKFCDRVMKRQGKISLWGTIFGTLAQLHDGEADGTKKMGSSFLISGKKWKHEPWTMNQNMGYGGFFLKGSYCFNPCFELSRRIKISKCAEWVVLKNHRCYHVGLWYYNTRNPSRTTSCIRLSLKGFSSRTTNYHAVALFSHFGFFVYVLSIMEIWLCFHLVPYFNLQIVETWCFGIPKIENKSLWTCRFSASVQREKTAVWTDDQNRHHPTLCLFLLRGELCLEKVILVQENDSNFCVALHFQTSSGWLGVLNIFSTFRLRPEIRNQYLQAENLSFLLTFWMVVKSSNEMVAKFWGYLLKIALFCQFGGWWNVKKVRPSYSLKTWNHVEGIPACCLSERQDDSL